MVNKVMLIGHVGADPELKHFKSSRLCKFSLATNKSWKDKNGEWNESTEWHNIVGWDKTAKYMKSKLYKGAKVYIEGELQTKSYEHKEKGKQYVTQVIVKRFKLLSQPKDGSGFEEAEVIEEEEKEDTPF